MPKEKILIVEDDGLIAANLQDMLLEMGYDVMEPISTGELAVDAVEANSPGLVLMDIKLAGEMNGIESATKIQTISDVPIIYLTAFTTNNILAKAKVTAPYGYLVKPVNERELRASIEMALSRFALYQCLVNSEKALRESEERHNALLDLGDRIGEAIIMIHDDNARQGVHAYASHRWQSITGYTAEELQKLSLFEIIHPRERAVAIDEHNRRMFGEVLSDLREFTIIRKDGIEIPVESTFAFSTFRGRHVDIGYIRDISGRKSIEEQLFITDRLAIIGDMAISIGHELNNPITSVLGFSEILLENRNLPENLREPLLIISKESQRINDIVHRLMLFNRSRNGGKEWVDINQVVITALELRSYEQKLHNITTSINLAEHMPKIWVEGFRLQQVFLNIMSNAEYFMSEANKGGFLQITTQATDNRVKISFIDDGPGLASKNLDGLFGSFFGDTPSDKGSNLSMGICRQLIKDIGGSIAIQNKTGSGTTVIVELPVASKGKDSQNE